MIFAGVEEMSKDCRTLTLAMPDIFIFDLRFAIADLSKCARSAPRNKSKIGNRNSKIRRLSRRSGPVAQLVRACA